ncbi:MAG: hypothetical protein PVI44_04320 [Balneolaceae bacterium]|jgi:hypothetical protein
MWNVIKVTILLSLLLLFACKEKHKKFTSRKPQSIEKRAYKDTLVPLDSLNLSKVDLYESGTLRINKTHLFVKGKDKIVIISKDNFDNHKTITFKKGKGPQEILQLESFDVRDSLLTVLDERQNKVLTYRLPNVFEGENKFNKVMPHRIRILNRNSYLLFAPASSEYLFNEVNTKKGEVFRFGKLPLNHNLLVFEGYIDVKNNNIYYAGFSEPMLKKYSLDGDLLYSVATIDNYDTEANYVKSEDGNNLMIGFTPAAQFSTAGFDIFNNYWFIIPYRLDNKLTGELDIYNKHSGKYLGTVDGLKARTRKIRADDNFIYAISQSQGDYVLTRYKNTIQF